MRVSTTVFTFSTMILFCNKLTWTGDGMQVICIIAYIYTVELSQGNKYKLKYCVKSGVKSVRVIYTYIYIYTKHKYSLLKVGNACFATKDFQLVFLN